MPRRTVRIVFIVLGAIVVLVGAVWAGQGANLIPGSFMTGDRLWLLIGLVAVVLGVVLMVRGVRGGRRRR